MLNQVFAAVRQYYLTNLVLDSCLPTNQTKKHTLISGLFWALNTYALLSGQWSRGASVVTIIKKQLTKEYLYKYS